MGKSVQLLVLMMWLTGFVCAQPIPPSAPPVVITEVFYAPPNSGMGSLEFVEVRNPSADFNRVIDGISFIQGIEFSFPSMIVEPHEFIVIAKDSVAFESVFGIPAFQWEAGDLDDSDETLLMSNALNVTQDSVPYSAFSPWPFVADLGASIVLCNDTLDNSDPTNWAASTNNTGIIINGVELHVNPGEACSIDNGFVEQENQRFSVYPNPSTGSVFIHSAEPFSTGWTIELLSASGQLLLSEPFSTQEGAYLTDLSMGMYLVRLSRQGELSTQRVVVIH